MQAKRYYNISSTSLHKKRLHAKEKKKGKRIKVGGKEPVKTFKDVLIFAFNKF